MISLALISYFIGSYAAQIIVNDLNKINSANVPFLASIFVSIENHSHFLVRWIICSSK